MQPKDKEIFRHKPANTINKEIPHLTRSYLEFCFTHSLEQIITGPTRITDQTATLIDQILTNSPDKVSQPGVIDLGLSAGADLEVVTSYMTLQSQILVTEPLFLTSDGYLNVPENIYYPSNFHTCTPLAVIPLLLLSNLATIFFKNNYR